MARMIIKRPDGKYAIWSSICDDFVFDGITKKEWVKNRIKEETERVKKDLGDVFKSIDEEKPGRFYRQFAMTYEEAKKLRDEIHKKGVSDE